MPGLFSRIGTAFSGSGQDGKLVARIEQFSNEFVYQSEVPKTLGLRREEASLLEAILADQLYRAYCAEHTKKEPSAGAIEHFAQARRERGARLGVSELALSHVGEALERVAGDLVDIARQRHKIQSGFDSVDGLTESIVSARISLRVPEVKASRRSATN